MSLNRCEFIGNLGADPEIRRMASGDPVVNFRIAVSDHWRDRQTGERRERTEWIPVVIFNEQLAKVAESYLKKGSKVFISGSWQTRKWADQSGQDRHTTECVLQKFRGELEMLDTKGENQSSGQRQSEQQSMYDRDDDRTKGGAVPDLDDEIPFAPEWR